MFRGRSPNSFTAPLCFSVHYAFEDYSHDKVMHYHIETNLILHKIITFMAQFDKSVKYWLFCPMRFKRVEVVWTLNYSLQAEV